MRERKGGGNQATLLEQASSACIIAGMFFWGYIFSVNLQPAHPIEYGLVLFVAVAYGLMLPLLINLLVPFTPAGQALQETRWRTIGFAVTIIVAGFMLIQAYIVILAYLQSKPVIVSRNLEQWVSGGFLIVFVFFPALSMPTVTPERWLSEMRIAQSVKRYKQAENAKILDVQAEQVLYLSILRRQAVNGLASATPEERRYDNEHLYKLHAMENTLLEQIVASMNDINGHETGLSGIRNEDIRDSIERSTNRLYALTDAAANRGEPT
jgi:hypothetical protein